MYVERCTVGLNCLLNLTNRHSCYYTDVNASLFSAWLGSVEVGSPMTALTARSVTGQPRQRAMNSTKIPAVSCNALQEIIIIIIIIIRTFVTR